jgi:2-polyprenyl-3-methyl-5-hydroxy-6-metoxy-1,4-benzoquinol methylase
VVTIDTVLRTNQRHRIGSGHPHILAIVSEEDRRHWDERHDGAGVGSGVPALPTAFAAIEDLFPIGGRALEIACGRGELSVWLAVRGMDVLGVDVSPVAVELARELADRGGLAGRCRFEVWDLDDGLPPSPPMDLVVCHMYRESRLDHELIERVAPGGLIAIASLSEVGGAPGRFRATPGELREVFAELEILSDGEGDGVAWLLGRKSG